MKRRRPRTSLASFYIAGSLESPKENTTSHSIQEFLTISVLAPPFPQQQHPSQITFTVPTDKPQGPPAPNVRPDKPSSRHPRRDPAASTPLDHHPGARSRPRPCRCRFSESAGPPTASLSGRAGWPGCSRPRLGMGSGAGDGVCRCRYCCCSC